MLLHAPAAVGDVLDRLTILAIKRARLPGGTSDPHAPDPRSPATGARAHVDEEYAALVATWRAAGLPDPAEVPEHAALAEVNLALWEVEDRLRAAEACGDFGPAFVADARAVYRTNDRRAALKRAVNLRFGSRLVEEKLHPAY